MQALILAGGRGTRLKAVVNDRPKPMARVDDGSTGQERPFLEYQLEFLKSHQILHFIFCVGYLNQHIREYFGNGSRWGVRIDYSIEEELLGTGGAVKLAERFVSETFLTVNGDSFLDLDPGELIQFHMDKKVKWRHRNYLGTIALTEVQDVANYGLVRLNQDELILDFDEKSSQRSTASRESNHINAGIYVLEPEILRIIPSNKKVSIEREVFPSVLNSGNCLGGYTAQGFFVDIGTPAGYQRLRNYLKERGTYDYQE